jgi:PleD family two-component response regulator
MMGGRIWLDSQLGRGSRFQFTAKLKFPGDDAIDALSASSLDLCGVRVLIVDDNATNRRILREMLSQRGATTSDVDCGEQALLELLAARAANTPFDLILTDMHMPNMDGIRLGRVHTI